MSTLPRISVDVSRWLAVGAAALALALAAVTPAAAEEARQWEFYGLYANHTECEKARQRLQYAPNVWASECRGFDNGDPSAALYVQWV
jgi:hypothetical protein